jgi:hypothetical protein
MDRIPSDQASMHPNIDEPPLSSNTDKYKLELDVGIQDLIQEGTGAELKEFGYTMHSIRSSRSRLLLLWLRFKTDLAMKDVYRFLRRWFRK